MPRRTTESGTRPCSTQSTARAVAEVVGILGLYARAGVLDARASGGGWFGSRQAVPGRWRRRRRSSPAAPTPLRCSERGLRCATRCAGDARYARTSAASQLTKRAARAARTPALLVAAHGASGRALPDAKPPLWACKEVVAGNVRSVDCARLTQRLSPFAALARLERCQVQIQRLRIDVVEFLQRRERHHRRNRAAVRSFPAAQHRGELLGRCIALHRA